nr:NBR1-Ig-like domain-containing protein [Psychromicrobium silvestre]
MALELRQAQRASRLLVGPGEAAEQAAIRSGLIDASEYVSETIPDGTLLPLNTTFTKSWTLKNVGEVPWIGRSLKRLTPDTALYPTSESMVPVPRTLPGELVVISVEVTTRNVPGFTEVRFKMVDAQGNLCWPDEYPYGATLAIETRNLVWAHREPGNRHRPWQE